ncbi:hypothetical protein C7I85_18865 [Mesorhizobium soli]|uniref:Peptidase M15C domain-containing protein n=2 Tax=Pseudaminobacter soli (ex Li et al. 2025) TaxID=1295366 RepID=A0A2P7S963_9HYPH|nr:hypothetical protein C7I85_18865 [Mesorhizobium soli]
MLEFERVFLKRLQKLRVPMFTHCFWRGQADQTARFVDGKSKAKWGQNPHNFGCAIDVIHARKAWALTREQWALLGHIGKEVSVQISVPVVWGGDWSFYDPAHWELKNWRELNWTRAETLEETFN